VKRTHPLSLCGIVLLLLVSCESNVYLLVPSASPAAALLGVWRNGTETYRFFGDYSYTYADSSDTTKRHDGAWRITDGMLQLSSESFGKTGGTLYAKNITTTAMDVSFDNLSYATWSRTGTGTGLKGTWTESGADPASLEISDKGIRYTRRTDGTSWVQYGGSYATTEENPVRITAKYSFQMRKYSYTVNATTLIIGGTSYLSY
jgi:hypothetical protein